MKCSDILNESMTMYADEPWISVSKECWACDGTGIEGFYRLSHPRKSYYVNPKEIKEKFIQWDNRLTKLFQDIESLDFRIQTISNWIEDQTDEIVISKLRENLKSLSEERKELQTAIDRRIARIERKIELVKGLKSVPCDLCSGTGVYKTREPLGPQMDLSNANAQNIMSTLGFRPDSGYTIYNKDIPAIKRKIIQLLNTEELSSHTVEPTDVQQDFGLRRTKDPETGLDKIERKKGARMISPGVDVEYLKDKFTKVLKILDYAQERGLDVHFA